MESEAHRDETTTGSAPHEVVEKDFRCINCEDWDSLAALWTQDAELVAVGARSRRGRDEILACFRKIFSLWHEHRDEASRLIRARDVVTAEIRCYDMTLDGAEVEFDAVGVFDVEDGGITRLPSLYDIAVARRAILGTA